MTLDEAWAEAMSTMTGHWIFDGLVPYPSSGQGWLARAKTDTECKCCHRGKVAYGHGFGATPEKALLDLAKKRREMSA